MAFKLVIGDVISVPVKGTINAAAGPLRFDFSLQMKRLNKEAYAEVFGEGSTTKVREFLLENTVDWRGQRLVHDERDQPAGFSREALECLLGIVGMEWHCTEAYTRAYVLSETPEGRRGNL